MKKNYFLTLLAVVFFMSANAQTYDLKAILVTPTTDTVKASGIRFQLQVKNVGVSTLAIGDTMFLNFTWGATSYSFNGTSNSRSYYKLASALMPDSSVTFSTVALGFTSHPTTQTYETICPGAVMGQSSGTDTNPADNQKCYKIDRSLVSLKENTLENNVTVFATTSKLDLSSTSNEALNYSVYSVSGKLVTSGSFTSSKQVDLNLATGIYAVVISNENERITKKIAVQ